MPMSEMGSRRRKILVADLLCGAGGSSTGCGRALAELGLEMELVCVNHWGIAIETHKKNHPEARHYCEDIATVRPHIVVPEGYLDLLMASPTCTHHSVARGGKPTSDQQRSDPWHIITWLTELRVKRIIIENVWEFTGWGPVDARTGKPIKARKGEYFRAWIETIRRLGFEPEWRKLNAANYGDATTRQRFILKARNDRKLVAWAPLTHAKKSDDLLLFPTLKPWRPAREIIDWSIKGKSIFDRKKPLAPKTLARIYAGAVKFQWPEPFLVVLRNHMAGQSVDGPLPTIAAEGQHIGLAEPVVMANRNNNAARSPDQPTPAFTRAPGGGGVAVVEPIVLSQHNSGSPRSAGEPLPTITTGGAASEDHPGCARPMLAEPVIVNGRKGNQAKGVSTDPVPTLDTKGGVWLAEPFILDRNGAEGGSAERRARSIDDPMPTSTNRGAGYVVEPFVATVAHGNSEGDRTADSRRVHSVDEPIGAVHAGGKSFAVVEPFVLSQASGGAPRGASEPLPTIVTGGERGSGTALISPYYGSGSGETCNTVEDPLPTVTARDRFGMVVPVTHGGGEDRAHSVEEPLNTITGANRGEMAFITAQHGEREGQAPRVHDIGQPAPTIAASGHIDLAQGVVTPVVEGERYDILFRMLEPHELAAAMGFSTEEFTYEFAGTKTDQVKQIGNAVSVAMMKAEVGAIMADAAPKKLPAPVRATEPGSAAA
jgi:DNA (cytosine-5)-methyltransferase 1